MMRSPQKDRISNPNLKTMRCNFCFSKSSQLTVYFWLVAGARVWRGGVYGQVRNRSKSGRKARAHLKGIWRRLAKFGEPERRQPSLQSPEFRRSSPTLIRIQSRWPGCRWFSEFAPKSLCWKHIWTCFVKKVGRDLRNEGILPYSVPRDISSCAGYAGGLDGVFLGAQKKSSKNLGVLGKRHDNNYCR